MLITMIVCVKNGDMAHYELTMPPTYTLKLVGELLDDAFGRYRWHIEKVTFWPTIVDDGANFVERKPS